jgi:outer membrane receptor for Fe3+-dicitrate
LRAGGSLEEGRTSDRLPDLSDEALSVTSANAVINETALRQLGYSNPEDALNTV